MAIPADPFDWEYPFGIPPMSREELIEKKPWLESPTPLIPWQWREALNEMGFHRLVEGYELSPAEHEMRHYINYCKVNNFPIGDVVLSQGESASTFKYRDRVLAEDPWPDAISFVDGPSMIMDRPLAEFVRDYLAPPGAIELLEFEILASGEVPPSRPTRVYVLQRARHSVHSFSISAQLNQSWSRLIEDQIAAAYGCASSYFLYEKFQHYDIWWAPGHLLVSPRGRARLLAFRPELAADQWGEPFFYPMGIAFPDGAGFEKMIAPEWPPQPLRIPTVEYLRYRIKGQPPTYPDISWEDNMLTPSHRFHHHFVAYCKRHNLPIQEC